MASSPYPAEAGGPLAVGVDSLSKRYGKVAALDGVSFSIPPGSVFGLVGPNGAGKTTLLSITAGLRLPSDGEVTVGGGPPRESRIGFMPDTPRYYPWLTGRELMVDVARLCAAPVSPEEAGALLAGLGLSGREDSRIGTYSRGMLQRMALAVTMLGAPGLVIMDEPCSALDPIGRVEVLELVASLGGASTVVFSTHLLSDVERICTHVAILDRGRLLFVGPMSEVRKMGAVAGFRLLLEEPSREVLDAILAFPWCIQVHEPTPGLHLIRVTDIEDARGGLLGILSEKRARVLEFVRQEPRLEDVFLRLVGADVSAPPGTPPLPPGTPPLPPGTPPLPPGTPAGGQ